MRSPLTAMIFTLELSHDLNLLPALLVSCIAAHALTVLWLRRSILTEKVARRGFHVTREYSVDPLAMLRIRMKYFMTPSREWCIMISVAYLLCGVTTRSTSSDTWVAPVS